MGVLMKKVFHFKSLTMRIWATFIIFIIIIVLAITLIYSTFIRQLEKNNQIQSLEFSHDTLYQILSQKQNLMKQHVMKKKDLTL